MQTEQLSTVSAISHNGGSKEAFDESRLTGQHVVLWPYVRGYLPRDLPYQLWSIMEKEDILKYVFYENPTNDLEQKAHGDLAHFIAFFSDPKKLILLSQHIQSKEWAGMLWVDVEKPGYRCLAGWWMRRRFWGEPTREAGRMACDYYFNCIGLEHIWGFTPWETSAKSSISFGFEYVDALPNYLLVNGKPRDAHVVHYAKANFKR